MLCCVSTPLVAKKPNKKAKKVQHSKSFRLRLDQNDGRS